MQVPLANLHTTGVSIGELASSTGVGVSTLRAWERRHGFPVPERLPSGHRRYPARDVELVRQVCRERAAGVRLPEALAAARRLVEQRRTSPFAALRAALPHAEPMLLSTNAMLGLSRAVEDEAAHAADDALFIGAFQQQRPWKLSATRWRNLAARADVVVVLAALPRSDRRGNVWRVALDPDEPLTQEWSVICDAATFTACVAGIERPREHRHSPRAFDTLWTVDPVATREAARAAATVAAAAMPEIGGVLDERLTRPAVARHDVVRSATSVANRLLTYLDRPT